MTTFTLDQDFAFAKLAMYSNVINGHTTGENTLGTQDAAVHWHPSEDELAYRWWNERNGVPLNSFIWPTSYVLNNDVSNGYHGVRLFDDSGKWLGTPDHPVEVPASAIPVATVSSATAPAPAVPVAEAPAPAVVVTAANPVGISAAAESRSSSAPVLPSTTAVHPAVTIHVNATPGAATSSPAAVVIHVNAPAAAVAPVSPVVVAPVRHGFWAWLARIFGR